jgi:hypothetical protein
VYPLLEAPRFPNRHHGMLAGAGARNSSG